MARVFYKFIVSILVNGEEKFKNLSLFDAIVSKIPVTGKYTLAFQHTNKVGFKKQASYLANCSEKLGIVVTIDDSSDNLLVAIETDSRLMGIAIVYLSCLCSVAPGAWPNHTSFEDSAKKILKDINVAGFKNFVTSGISGSHKIPLAKQENLDKAATELTKARKEVVARLTAK